jgi:CheY-like chemotaxis protein
VRALAQLGYRVLEAGHAAAALELIEDEAVQVDLLLTDVVMPGLDGRRLAEVVHRARPGLKVLFVSGYTDEALTAYRVHGEDAALLHKPFAPDALGRKVRRVLDASARAASP